MIELITPQEIKAHLTFVKNLDEQVLQPYINTSIDIQLTELLGEDMEQALQEGEYEDVLPYAKNFLMWNVLSEVVIPLTFKLRNAGIVNSTGDHIQVVTMKDAEVLKNEYAHKAHSYQDTMLNYLKDNNYISCQNKDTHNFNGVSIFLG